MSYDVYGIGNALLDIQYDVSDEFLLEHQIAKGLMSYVEHQRQDDIMDILGRKNVRQISSGGSVANSMIVMSQFGANTFFSCRIADDEAGDQYYQDMKRAGLHCNFDSMARAKGLTGRCLVKITPDAERTMCTYLGTSIELCEEQLDIEALKQSTYLYIEGYLTTSPSAMKAVKHALGVAKAHGVKIAVSLSDPQIVKAFKAQFHDIIDDGVDLIFANEQEAMYFTDTDNLIDAEQELKRYTKAFAVTIGPKGSIVFDGNELITIPATEEKPVDTLGAGDMYAGAFLYGITQGLGWYKSGLLANITSSKVVTLYGPRVSKEHTDDLLKQLETLAIAS
jgi:sugar/nucleoside kinase (ribokinase family)